MEKRTWITGRFVVYMILLAAALVFTQALRSTASAVLFVFMLILPVVSFILVLVARASVRVDVECPNTRVEKDADVEYEIRIANSSFIPLPFLEAHLIVPEDGGVRCTDRRMMVSLMPGGVTEVKHTVRFHYRGRYDIGVLDMRVKDALGLFSAPLPDSVTRTVIVFPRMLEITGAKESATTELPTDLSRRAITDERSEQANIREYVGGDALKDIHWKLSSKVDELLVRDYNINDQRHVYVVCDLTAPRFPDEYADEKGADENGAKDGKHKRKRAKKRAGKRNVRRSAEAKVVIEADTKKELSQKRAEFCEQIVSSVIEDEAKNAPKKRALPRIRAQMLDEIAELRADSAVELAIAAVMRELRSGGDVTLVWSDDGEEDGVRVSYFPDVASFAGEVLDFALTPACRRENGVASLFSAIEDTNSLTVKFVTANLEPSDVGDYLAFSASTGSGASDTSVEVYLAQTDGAYEDAVARAVYVSAMREELAACAVKLTEYRETPTPDGTLAFAKEADLI